MPENSNPYFDLQGLTDIAWASSDMERTVAFYNGVLGLPISKTMELPDGTQFFAFDIGEGQEISFIWDPDGGPVSGSTESQMGLDGSTNHVSLRIEVDKVVDYFVRLRERGVDPGLGVMYYPGTPTAEKMAQDGQLWVHIDGSDSYGQMRQPSTITLEELVVNDDICTAEIQFKDPDGFGLEFTADFADRVTKTAESFYGNKDVKGKSRPIRAAATPE
jgi:catechol 2,3-dioxygenase-like lactoylglutathione lyase family enzyme